MKFMRSFALLFCLLIASLAAPASTQEKRGQFLGELITQIMEDGRNLKLVQPFSYIDSDGQQWNVPAGTVTDGASVPRAFWIAYPPFTGLYRKAAVIHDYYCQTRERGWRLTHKVFYDAMRSAGVDDVTARMMYGAVFYMGPRWGFGAQTRGPGAERLVGEQEQLAFMNRLEDWIKRENPTPELIAKAIEAGQLP
jgi:hypothetical protein